MSFICDKTHQPIQGKPFRFVSQQRKVNYGNGGHGLETVKELMLCKEEFEKLEGTDPVLVEEVRYTSDSRKTDPQWKRLQQERRKRKNDD